jgi:hypothetical protein
VSKCKALHISRKKPGTINDRQYNLDDQPLVSVSSYSDLGILVSNTLTWGNHIEEMVSRANKTLGLIKRICKDLTDPSIRKVLYCSLVRSKREYGSNLWCPYTKKHRKLIENVQRRATKFILNYPDHMSYTCRPVMPIRHFPTWISVRNKWSNILIQMYKWSCSYRCFPVLQYSYSSLQY